MALDSATLATSMKSKLDAALGAVSGADDTNRAAICTAFAEAFVEHLVADGDIRITTSDGGLQRDPATGDPTDAPSSDVVLSGAIE